MVQPFCYKHLICKLAFFPAVPSDPRSPTIEMSRTPLVEAAPFVDPRSPDNTILRTPLDKTSGFKGFNMDDSLPYIDESQVRIRKRERIYAWQDLDTRLLKLRVDGQGH